MDAVVNKAHNARNIVVRAAVEGDHFFREADRAEAERGRSGWKAPADQRCRRDDRVMPQRRVWLGWRDWTTAC